MLGDNGNSTRKSSDFGLTAETFVRAVRTLMYGYALVSAVGAKGHEWCALNAAATHIATVEYYSRLNSKCNHTLHNRLMEIEMTVRTERDRVCQQDIRFSLGGAVSITAQRQLWPFVSEFRSVKGKGKGKGCLFQGYFPNFSVLYPRRTNPGSEHQNNVRRKARSRVFLC